jgi:hypothetical protein
MREFCNSFCTEPRDFRFVTDRDLHTLEAMDMRRIWRDKDGRIVLWQWPNIWIIIWAIMTVLRLVSRGSSLASFAHIIGTGALIIWALLEVFRGVNYFRRVFGLIILLITIASILKISL